MGVYQPLNKSITKLLKLEKVFIYTMTYIYVQNKLYRIYLVMDYKKILFVLLGYKLKINYWN